MKAIEKYFESALHILARTGYYFVCLLGELALIIPKLVAGKERVEQWLYEN